MKAFDGLERFKEKCRALDEPKEPLPMSEPVQKPKTVVVPRSGLFNIWKRSTNQSDPEKKINKCVAIGFTYADSVRWIQKRLKTKWDVSEANAVYYDIMEQENEYQSDPFWNPKEITKEGGTYTTISAEDATEWKG